MKDSTRVKVAILAGGQGSRLYELTTHRAKPALPIFAKYLIIDCVVSNAYNSGYHSMDILTQYMANSVSDHIQSNWASRTGWNDHIITHPPKMRKEGEFRYDGTANAVYQNWYELTKKGNPELILVLSGDHVHKMDYGQMKDYHTDKDSEFTVSTVTVPVGEAAGAFGVIEVDENYRVIGFQEKPQKPAEIPGMPGYCLASMGNYIMPVDGGWDILEKEHQKQREKNEHDFGKHIIPDIIDTHRVFAYRFEDNVIAGETKRIWRDVGTIPAYFDANMDVCSEDPDFSLYSQDDWPIPSGSGDATAPHKNVEDCMIGAGGSLVDKGSSVHYVSLHKEARVIGGAEVDHCVIMDYSRVEASARLRNTIVDKRIHIPKGTIIGYDREADEDRGFRTVDYQDGSWITVVPLEYKFS